ncbi:4-hydroxyphenylpyruvate dioxygenase [Micromonospora sp. A3M-1-15]|uniref:4-hydroxyphenylpyruvate dioxygenase n=1 Tax=Micromonospora sp. A3M-1-15 TaxID=2962035 RepID=UPI0020B83D52|nr:4-hydroxyphenylpyruvate dioxygenase [Micromonospora sp. A3M-1-15]MCP3786631.1 4-hydroxyphenylpyruvate dioxygenase [Micromonospora sp. A3M-1-15]
MVAREIEYVELYVGDQRSAVDYFVSRFGFRQVAESAVDDTRSTLLRQGTVKIIVTAGPKTWKFLDGHGDGIADIALTCDDVDATVEAAAAAGATVSRSFRGHPVVTGFGDVGHTLLPATGGPTDRLPAIGDWTPSTAPDGPAGRIRKLDHVAVCLAGGTLEQHADYYGAALGLDRYFSEYVAVGDQAMDSIVVRSASGEVTFTLVAPDPTRSPGQLDAFLGRNGGPGVQHLAFLVDEIVPAVREYGALGVEFLNTPDTYYEMLADRFTGMTEEISQLRETNVLADRDEWGYLLQLFTRSPYEANTLFYELIQRRGSRGFGSRNIRALYEAVERDRLTAD